MDKLEGVDCDNVAEDVDDVDAHCASNSLTRASNC